ncbi:MAG: PAS domain-containing protein [bacterium]
MKESMSRQSKGEFPHFNSPADIRRLAAEQQLEARDHTSPADTGLSHASVVHELQVHQIELEMQNEELRRSQLNLETAYEKSVDLFDLAPIGYLTVGEKGLIQEANIRAAELLGVDRKALARRPLSQFILGQDQEIFCRHRKQIHETGVRQVCELRMLGKGGGLFWVRMETIAADGDDGASVLRVSLSDVTEQKNAETALALLANQYKIALEEVKTLRGLISICSSCKKIRINRHEWEEIESYVARHTEAKFSHGLCTDCIRKIYPEDAAAILSKRDEQKRVSP